MIYEQSVSENAAHIGLKIKLDKHETL